MTNDGHTLKLGACDAPVKADPHTPSVPPELHLAAGIVDVSRELARSLPAPRGAPYFCLDTEAGYDLSVLDPLCTRGIFRKYELALDIGSGLGGRARWLAARAYCRVVGVDPRPAAVVAAGLLNRRARMDDQVMFQVGRFDSLPLRERVFTHVWLVDIPWDAAAPQVLAEAFRVLRRGAHFAMQCPMPAAEGGDGLVDALRRLGFVDVEAGTVTSVEPPQACRFARARLDSALGAGNTAATAAAPNHRRLQIFARRPA